MNGVLLTRIVAGVLFGLGYVLCGLTLLRA